MKILPFILHPLSFILYPLSFILLFNVLHHHLVECALQIERRAEGVGSADEDGGIGLKVDRAGRGGVAARPFRTILRVARDVLHI